MKDHKNDFCVDCKVNCLKIKEYYMVTDSCWKRAGMQPLGGMLCIGCLEKRLGKKLTARNFTDCSLNWRSVCLSDQVSSRLLSRMLNGKKWREGVLKLYTAALAGNKKLLEEKLFISFDKEICYEQ